MTAKAKIIILICSLVGVAVVSVVSVIVYNNYKEKKAAELAAEAALKARAAAYERRMAIYNLGQAELDQMERAKQEAEKLEKAPSATLPNVSKEK